MSVEEQLVAQGDGSRVTEFRKTQLERDAQKNWDKFYLRNETNFFKDRHWTIREFTELTGGVPSERRVLLEVGCGVGNFIFPLVESEKQWFVHACDFSSRAVNFVQTDPRFNSEKMSCFVADVTRDDLFERVREHVDVVTMIFMLSAVHPLNFVTVFRNALNVLKPGGFLLFRDYGLHDMAQIRFKAANKLGDNFYVRQDGTRSYYFTHEQLRQLGNEAGFEVLESEYVYRMTVNKKEGIEAKRTFVQAKLRKPD